MFYHFHLKVNNVHICPNHFFIDSLCGVGVNVLELIASIYPTPPHGQDETQGQFF